MESAFLPTSKKEVEALGWDYIDVILFTGDAYVDHPSFGTAVIGRILEREGYRVAIVPQPNWRDDLRDFKKLGQPRLFFGVNSGAMDSMVNHYTANKRLRSDDAYTPDGKASFRPDYAVNIYSNILKQLYPDVPLVIGGIEASLRRLTHYDYWKDKLLPSILVTSGADYLIYGMGERPICALAKAIENGASIEDICQIPQIGYLTGGSDDNLLAEESVFLHSYEQCVESKRSFVENFNAIELEANKMHARRIVEPYENKSVVINPPYPPATEKEMDSFFDLPYTKLPHPRYRGKRIPAYDMIKFSINIHHGCFGGCSFCTIAAHQGRFIQSRSCNSIVTEINKLVSHPEFKGIISDVGAPTANMYSMGGVNEKLCEKCSRKSCLFPGMCPNLNHSHKKLLDLYSKIAEVKGVKKFFIGSGIRYDLFLNEDGFLDESSYPYLRELVVEHTSGRLKVAPEHTEDNVLRYMSKPSFSLFVSLRREFEKIISRGGLRYQLVPYFISSHPGCTMADMSALSRNPHLKGLYMEQVQDFTPTPMTASSVMYYSGLDLHTLKPIYVERNQQRKKEQKTLLLGAGYR
jgi:uncharacterized radical SAM protein YgiQ